MDAGFRQVLVSVATTFVLQHYETTDAVGVLDESEPATMGDADMTWYVEVLAAGLPRPVAVNILLTDLGDLVPTSSGACEPCLAWLYPDPLPWEAAAGAKELSE